MWSIHEVIRVAGVVERRHLSDPLRATRLYVDWGLFTMQGVVGGTRGLSRAGGGHNGYRDLDTRVGTLDVAIPSCARERPSPSGCWSGVCGPRPRSPRSWRPVTCLGSPPNLPAMTGVSSARRSQEVECNCPRLETNRPAAIQTVSRCHDDGSKGPTPSPPWPRESTRC